MLEIYLEGGRWVVLGTHARGETVRAEPFDAVELSLGRWRIPGSSADAAVAPERALQSVVSRHAALPPLGVVVHASRVPSEPAGATPRSPSASRKILRGNRVFPRWSGRARM